MRTLKSYFKIQIIIISAILFICFYLFSNYLFSTITQQENDRIADAISEQVFASMYQVMRKGWAREDLRDFLMSLEHSFDKASHKVEIYRSTTVEARFGVIKQGTISPEVAQVMKNGDIMKYADAGILHTLTPIRAKNECLACHTNARENDVLGVIAVAYDGRESARYSQQQFLLMSLLLFPLILFIAYLLARNGFERISRFFEKFQEKIRSVNSVKAFKTMDIKEINSGFDEIDAVVNEFDALAYKLKEIAVDKEILEFEVKLLDKFIITSDVVRDWKEHIKVLLHDINTVMPVYSLVTIFESKEGLYEIEIFWAGKPGDDCKVHMEEAAQQMIRKHPMINMRAQSVIHNICNEEYCLTGLDRDGIDHESKSLLLDAPKIGGIVGLGLQTKLSRDSVFSIVIDSVLTTLINLVGSIKAINKYTDTLEYYATRDPLTGLFNQRVFRDLLGYEIKRAKRHEHSFGLLVIDCDNFKPINDTYGHSFGDRFLQEFAHLLQKTKRDEDMLARYGGDEFTLIIPESGEGEVYTIARRIQNAVDGFELSAPDGTLVHVTVSIGIAIYPDHAQNKNDLFNIADHMMYRGKEEGKHAIRSPLSEEIQSIQNENSDKALLVLDAIKNQRIVAHFQPIMRLHDDQIVIHELLMRIDIENMMFAAGHFIEKAEALGVIHQMDYIVIEKAFAQTARDGYEGTLFINLSPKALIVSEFIDKINMLVHQYGLQKSNIVFEITERETVKSFALLERFVQNLKLEGYRFAIDDFGSGFSSFHYIKKFPIDFIKIDGEFIINMEHDHKDFAFVKSIVSLAKELEVKTVAEFVETESQLELLRKIGIDYVQGYHIGKPAAAFTR